MPTFIVKKRTFVFKSATDLSTDASTPILDRCARFKGKLSSVANDVVDKTDEPTGVVPLESVEDAPESLEPIATDSGRTSFCRTTTDAAFEEKADRNYLLSVAYFQSDKLRKFGKPTDDRLGPFAYSGPEWCKAVDAANAAGHKLRVEHLFDPVGQATVAAIRTGKAMTDFDASEKRMPLPVELFFFERLGKDGLKLLQLDPTRPCSEAFAAAPAAGSYGAEIAAKKSGDVIKAVKDGLTQGFIDSRADVERLPPHLRFYSDEDAAPWLTVARLMKGDNLEGKPTALAGTLQTFFHSMGGNDRRSAAFVAFCLIECGVTEAKKKVPANNTAGQPGTWAGWASAAPTTTALPAGSIVVTKPEDGKQSVGILAATPKDDNYQVWFCSDDGPTNVGIKPIAKDKVEAVRWFDITGAGDPTSSTLGSLSKKFESGSGGPGTVSSGQGDAGGVSYGTYQFATNTGSARAFVDSLPDDLKSRFGGAAPGTPAFSAVWKAIAAEDPGRFEKLQHDHIKAKFYDVLVSTVKTKSGFDVNTRSAALQNCCWSTAVQHGPAGGASIVNGVIGPLAAGGVPPLADLKAFDAEALRKIYFERGRGDGTVHFPNCEPSVQKSVVRRFHTELADALKMLDTA